MPWPQCGSKALRVAVESDLVRRMMGKVAIANAKLTYQRSKEIFRGARWKALVDKSAHRQRLLWGSTSTKNPQYRDVLYVEELIIDVMDGRFVPNISSGMPIVKAMRRGTSFPLEMHLMIVEPKRYVEAFMQAWADMVIVHQGSRRHPGNSPDGCGPR